MVAIKKVKPIHSLGRPMRSAIASASTNSTNPAVYQL